MAVPIGMDAEGIARLDLSRHGPHALVAGTTGAGKSEFLLTYLRGLFALNSPHHVNALLIDYKGGATFGPLMQAPHVVGVVTDLDDGLAARALLALRAEIKRRERILSEAGFSSYHEAMASAGPQLTLPRLFVIVDEFRVLADELPDFVAGLVRLAAVGRSLGMHLVLATQRPGGAVSADMRANLDVRVALRVRERSDSLDVIETRDAARISPAHPGRGFLALSGEAPRQFQTGYTGASRRACDISPIHVHPVSVSDEPTLDQPTCPACQPACTTASSDLAMFVTEAVEAARGLPPTHRPLLPALPDVLDGPAEAPAVCVDGLTQFEPSLRPAPGTPFAVADLPSAHLQPGVTARVGLHIGFAGAPASGRTSAANAYLRSLRCAHPGPVWWVGTQRPADIDISASDRVVDPTSPEAVIALLTALTDDALACHVVIDGWELLHATLLRINHGTAAEEMLRHVEQAHRLGRSFIITGARGVLTSKLAALLDVKVVMRQNDPTEYSLAGLRPTQVPTRMPPGRGLVLLHGHVVQMVHSAGTPARI